MGRPEPAPTFALEALGGEREMYCTPVQFLNMESLNTSDWRAGQTTLTISRTLVSKIQWPSCALPAPCARKRSTLKDFFYLRIWIEWIKNTFFFLTEVC